MAHLLFPLLTGLTVAIRPSSDCRFLRRLHHPLQFRTRLRAKMLSRIERKLFDHGHFQTVIGIQKVTRIAGFFLPLCWCHMADQSSWIYNLTKLDFEGMDLILAEVAHLQDAHRLRELQKLNGSLTTEETEKLTLVQRQISKHEQSWWSFISRYHDLLYKKPKGSYIRRLDLLCSGKFLPTQEEVQRACKTRGGCCAYSCNCCYRDRGSSRMPGVLMHCIRNCVCCSQRRPPDRATEFSWKNEKVIRVLANDYYCRNKITF